ncbi:hypothetical protein HRbin15_01486 [bacterium HR15]|nr:hypothetical protein HRbin15_01486 [bacterium HR15]
MPVWFLVEGDADAEFIERIIAPAAALQIRIYRYARKPKQTRQAVIHSLHSMETRYYILVDQNHRPCITACRDHIREQFGQVVDTSCIIVVARSIEAWYLAGYTGTSPLLRGLAISTHTNSIDKQQFEQKIQAIRKSPTLARSEMLNHYDLTYGRQRNRSLDYFCHKLGIP